jgi:hypothetical protein
MSKAWLLSPGTRVLSLLWNATSSPSSERDGFGAPKLVACAQMLAGEAKGLRDADQPELRVLDLDLSWRKPVCAHLEDVADGQPRVVAEGLAVHDERVRLDPLDGHPQMTESSRTPAPLKMKRATGLPLWSPGRRLYIRSRLNQASPMARAPSTVKFVPGSRPPGHRLSVCWSLAEDATTSIDGHDPLCPLGHVARFTGLQRQRELLDMALVVRSSVRRVISS